MELVIGNGLLLVLVIIEILVIRFFLKEELPWKEIVLNLNSGHILLWVFRGIEIAAYYNTLKYFSFGWMDSLPYWLKWLSAFILWDFCFYWLHRTHHLFKVLWSVHLVHHEGEHFSLSLGIRNSWYSSLTSFPYFIGLALIGIPVEIFVAVSSIHYFVQFYNHTHLVKKSGWLEYIMITPSHHRVHHGKNQPYFNKNFGGTFVFWDKLFGTFQVELDHIPVIFGTDEIQTSQNPIVVNNAPFIKLLGFDPVNKKNSQKERTDISNSILVSGALLLFILLVFYIYFENKTTDVRSILLFTMVFCGTIGIGLLSDGSKWGIPIWIVSIVGIPVIFLFFFKLPLLIFSITLVLSIAHGCFTFLWWYIYKSKLLFN